MFNLPQTPGALLGHTKHGRPIHLIAGGSEPAPEPAPTPEPPAPPAAEPAPAPQPPAPEPAQPAPGAPAEPTDVGGLPEWAQKLLADTRKEAGDNRVKLREAETAAKEAKQAAEDAAARQQAMLDTIAKGLGLKPDDTPPDPAKLAEQLAAANAETAQRVAEKREADVMLAVYRAAGKHDADTDALLDSRSFQQAVRDLDPAAPDFSDRIGEAITKAIEANPRFKLPAAAPAAPAKPAPVKAKSGGEFAGTPGGNRQWTAEDVAAASPSEVAKAVEDGLLVDMGFNPPKSKR